jgi:glucose-6-phosphate 1-dehydrogenase
MSDAGIQIEAHLQDEPVLRANRPDPCTLVMFGATGDLAHRKLIPALYQLAAAGLLPEAFALIGFSRSVGESPDAFAGNLRESLSAYARVKPIDEEVWRRFAARIHVVPGANDDAGAFARLREKLAAVDALAGTSGNRLFYLATPADAFPVILGQLRAAQLVYPVKPGAQGPWSRVVIEKPIGHDLASARALNHFIGEVLDESQAYRIDHYLGKETVQNILVFRFANAIFEPLWNRKYIDHVQITAAEEIGVEGRVGFYDQTGALRDMVQNHLLQVLSLVAMEPPSSFGADDIRDEKAQALRSIRRIEPDSVDQVAVRGQYAGYTEVPGVARGSQTPTFVAMKLMIDNWRWQGVPFYIRTGKALATRVTEVAVTFQPVPMCLFGREEVCALLKPNVLTLRIQPNEGIALQFESKVPGDDLVVGDVTMSMSYAGAFERQPSEAYERLLLDAMRGNATLYSRRDAVELSWALVDPVLAAWTAGDGASVRAYARGSAGPQEADALIWRDGRQWRPLR